MTTIDQGMIPFYTTQFTQRLELLLQQKGSKLRGRVEESTGYVGKLVSPVNQIGAIKSRAPKGRFAPKTNTVQDYVRRWLTPQDRVIEQLYDNFDQLRTIVDPKSMATQNAAYACGRDWDDAVIAAATGTALIGQDASSLTTESFVTSSFQVAANFGAAAATGLTVAKMIEARRILRHYENDLENDPVTIVIGSQQESDLLKQVQVTSAEYNAEIAKNTVLVDGKVTRFVGMDVVVMERLPQTTLNTTRGVLVFVRSGLHLGLWQEVKTQIFQRPDLEGNPWDVSTVHTFGATRTQPGKVLQVLCADTSGAPIDP
jgi:hypothetical protein